MTPMEMLKEFHDKYDQGEGLRLDRPITIELLKKRRSLIKEEFTEVIDQLDYVTHQVAYPEDYDDLHHVMDSWESLAKELADLLYVIYGTAEELSIPLDKVFEVVHQSNMDKLWPDGQVHYNKEGKVLKPPTYSPPDLSIVNEHRVQSPSA